MSFDLEAYRRAAERFLRELNREYYLHHAGRKATYDIAAIHQRYAGLFQRDAVGRLGEASAGARGDERRRLRYLAHFAFEGCLGAATKEEARGIAELEARMEVEADSRRLPYRAVAVAQANEPDGARRLALEQARNEQLSERLNPLYGEALAKAHALARELGWESYRAAFSALRGVDLQAVSWQMRDFLAATDAVYGEVLEPELQRAGLGRLGDLERHDLPRFFRAVHLDGAYPAEGLVASFRASLSGLGIDVDGQRNVHLDTEARPTKTPRAFCATPRVPGEIYLVISPVGGRDDYSALFHEGGHAEHYATTDRELAFEFRHLGDNSVTESFAFLLEHLVVTPQWVADRLAAEPAAIVSHARAAKLVMLRRYAAKIAYELELHGAAPDVAAMPERYARLLGDAVRVRWPRVSWLSDVDSGFYVACYLRAWALEAHWRRALSERFGERWFEQAAAGAWLRSIWRQGQRLDAGELLAEALGEELDFTLLARELAGSRGADNRGSAPGRPGRGGSSASAAP